MKKSFTFFAISALFLMLLFPVSVKADTTLSFVYSSTGQDTHCNGSNTYSDKGIMDSDFRWSDNNKDNVKNVYVSSDKWTGVKSDYTACSRNPYHFDGSSCTLNLLINQLWDNVERSLPSITINGNTYYAAQATWGESSSETIVDNKFNFTDSKNSKNTPVTFVYNNVNPGTGDFDISVYFPSGDADKFLVKTLTITQNAATYAVTATASNGSVSGTGSFAEGASVTLTASPNEDYSFSSWSTSDVNISGHENENPLTFTMPNKAVSITASFTACTKHTVTLADDGHGSASGGGLQCDGSVTVTATPYTGYRFVNWTRGGSQVSTDAVYTFTLSEDISLTANFEVNLCTNTKTIQCEDYDPEITKPEAGHAKPNNYYKNEWDGYGAPDEGYFADFQNSENDKEIYYNVYLPAGTYTFNLRCSNGGQKKVVLYNAAGDTKLQELNLGSDWGDPKQWYSYTTDSWTATSAGYYYIGLRAEGQYAAFDKMTITATSDVFCPNTITMQKSGDASADDPTSSPASAAMAGTKVTITAGEASANHNFINWTATPAVTFEDATALSTRFVMPANAVTITANYGEVVSSALTFAADEGGAVVSATAGGEDISSGDAVFSGTSVTLTAGANTNYVFINWTNNNNNDAVVSTNAVFTFSMPATATSYTAHFAQIDNVIITGDVDHTEGFSGDGNGTMNITSVADFDAFNHNVLKFAYSNMSGNHKGKKILINTGYSSSASAQATGFGFYYKTEKEDDHVAFCFEVSSGEQVKWQLAATNNEWKYFYFPHAGANSWNGEHITIFMNGSDIGNYGEWENQSTSTKYPNGGAFYMSEIAATSIISKDDIASYTYTREIASNSYGTLCLPMDGLVSGATLYSVAGKQEEGGKLYIVLEEQGATLEAGEPYIFEANGLTLTATMSGPHSAVKADANGLVGTYQLITAPVYNGSDNLNYVLALDGSNNTVFKKVGEDVTVGAYRAYLNIHNAGDYSPASAAPGRKYIRFGIEGTEEAQAVEMIYDDASLRTRKIMQNGHLYILRDGHLFTAQGTQIK